MSNALTLHDMSPGLRKVVGRESPRATLAEEPDAGNPLVRIWRGAELGNRSAYSTRLFCAVGVGAPAPSAGRHGTLDTMRKDYEGCPGPGWHTRGGVQPPSLRIRGVGFPIAAATISHMCHIE